MARLVVVIGLTAALGFWSSTGRAQTALAVFDTLDVRHDLSKPAITRFQAARYHATACMYNGMADEQRTTSLLLRELAIELKRDTLLAHANVVVGYSFRQGGDPERALQYMYKGLEYAEHGGDTDQIGWAEKEIGIQFKQLEQYRQAIHWLKRGEAKIKRLPEVNRVNCHLSEAYSGLGMVDSALFYAQRSNVIASAASDPYGYARSQLTIGKAYAAKGESEMAALFFKKTIALCDSFHIGLVMPAALVALGHTRLTLNDAAGAIELGTRALRSSELTDNLWTSLEATDLLEKAYHAAGKPDSAYLSLKRHAAFQDNLASAQVLSKVENMRFAEQLKEKEEEQARIEAQQERSRNIQFGIIALIVITLGIFLLVFSRTAVVGAKAIKNLSLIALLLFFEFINLLLHPFLDRITNHSPILMLLCMAAIAGLLIPLHHRMEHLITNMLVSKNNRVRLEAARRTIEELESTTDQTSR